MNQTIQDLVANAPDKDHALLCLIKAYTKQFGIPVDKVRQLVLDGNVVFPIFYSDTLETIIERFAVLFPILTKACMEQAKDARELNKTGMSGQKQLKAIFALPSVLRAAIESQFGNGFLSKRENVQKILHLFPKLAHYETKGKN